MIVFLFFISYVGVSNIQTIEVFKIIYKKYIIYYDNMEKVKCLHVLLE